MRTEHLKLYGNTGYLTYLIHRFFKKFLRINLVVYYLMAKSIDGDIERSSDTHRLNLSDVLCEQKSSPHVFNKNIGIIINGMRKGDDFIAMYHKEEIVSYGMINYNCIPLMRQNLQEGDAYFYFGNTRKEYRGRHHHKYMTYGRLYYAKQKDKKRALCIVRTYNRASINALKFEGFHPIQTFMLLRFWKFRFTNFKYPD